MMASKASTSPMLRNIVLRTYSAQAEPRAAGSSGKLEQTVLSTKLAVASLQSNTPVTRVSVLFRAGSRNENSDEIGAIHGLRIAAGLSTNNASKLAITRNLQKVGASLTATADRESISYTLEGTQEAVAASLPILAEVASGQAFKPWEIKDELHRVHYENVGVSDAVRAVELLHRAAFRTGLGNSLFCPRGRINKLDSETLKRYVANNFTAPRAAVAGVGISQSELMNFAKNLSLASGEGPATPSKYSGGEIRKEKASQLAHVALAVNGASLKDTKNALAFSVLQQILGAGPSVKWGKGAGTLVTAVNAAAGNVPVAVTALNAEYTDGGLFGALVSCPAENAGSVVKAAANVLKSGNITDADVKRGKALLKFAVTATNENGHALVEEIGQQALLLGKVQSINELVQAIESVTTSDVQNAASAVCNGKLSMASVGNLARVPYIDEL